MTGKELWGSILQKAMEGKLVPQRKEEGTAAELLKEIRKERAKLVKEGKLKKTKPLPAVSEEEKPFDIPDSWEWVRLGEVCNVARGGSPRPIKSFLTENAEGINWIKIGDTDKTGKYINSTAQKIIKEGVVKSRFVHKGDLLLTNSMSFGHPYILNINGCIHDGWLVLFDYESIYYREFLYYLLCTPFIRFQFVVKAAGAVVKNLNSDKVSQTIVPLPPLPEQHRIVEKLETLKPLVDAYGQAAEELDELNRKFPGDLKKSLLQQAMEGKLVTQRKEEGTAAELLKEIRKERAKMVKEGKQKKTKPLPAVSEEEKPFDIPDSWEWVRFSEVVQIINGDRGKNYPSKAELSQFGDIPFISAANIEKGTIDKNGLLFLDEKRYNQLRSGKLKKGDLVLCIRGSLGKNGLYPYERGAIASSLVIIRSILNVPIIYKYISAYFNTQLFQSEINRYNNGTAQPNLGARDLAKFLLPFPPLPEQHRIVKKLESLLALCDKLQPED